MSDRDSLQLSPFKHVALHPGSIRVFDLLPGSHDAPIIGLLRHIALNDESEPYQALSYAWGETVLRETISCNNCALRVTSNLHHTLRRLRSPTTTLVLWIDAISINQDKSPVALEERAQQVALMSVIFSNAVRVIIDVGHTDQDLKYFVKYIEYFAGLSDEDYEQIADATDFCMPATGLPDIGDLQLFRQFLIFLQLPWFHRLWCFQEFVLARDTATLIGTRLVEDFDVYAGLSRTSSRLHQTLKEMDPVTVTELMAPNLDLFSEAISALECGEWLRTELNCGDELSVESVFRVARFLRVTDPRDRVYAIRSLLPDEIVHDLRVDYTESLQAHRLRISSHLIQKSYGIWVLMHSIGPNTGSPSWAMSLKAEEGEMSKNEIMLELSNSEENFEPLPNSGNFMAGGTNAYNIRLGSSWNSIEITGCIFDCIVSVSKSFTSPISSGDKLKGARTMFEELKMIWDWAEEMKIPEVVLWRVLILSEYGEGHRNNRNMQMNLPESALGTSYYKFKETVRLNFGNNKEIDMEDLNPVLEPLMRDLQSLLKELCICMVDMALAMTAKGSVAIVQRTAKVGDSVAIFAGVNCPFIVRAKGTVYETIGPSYLHAYMDGQALQDQDWKPELLVFT